MLKRGFLIGFLAVLIMGQAEISYGNDRLVRLAMPAELAESGLPKFMLPRFTLKTQVRVEVVEIGESAEAAIRDTGRPVFEGLDQIWHLDLLETDHPGAQKLADWMTSDVGQRTITSFAVDGVQLFSLPPVQEAEVVEASFDGDAALGATRSQDLCGRCHVVDPARRMGSIGSTPSFFALRTLTDWEDRFQTFYVLNPHPAFTQVEDVTEPFPEDRPSPIVPVEMTLDDVDAILAFVAGLTPADLGSPLQHQ